MLWANKTRGTDGGPRSVVRPNQDFGPISRRNAVVLDERDDRGRGALDACPRARAHGSVFGRGRYAIRIFDDILSAGASSAARSTMMISMDSAIVCVYKASSTRCARFRRGPTITIADKKAMLSFIDHSP